MVVGVESEQPLSVVYPRQGFEILVEPSTSIGSPKPKTLNPEPQTLNPKPKTLNPKP